MTNQNNAAQATVNTIIAQHFGDDPAGAARALIVVNKVLSKLHTPAERAAEPLKELLDELRYFIDSAWEEERTHNGIPIRKVPAGTFDDLDRAYRAALASAPVTKPKRAPVDDWRVQAIAECLETEWDDMTPASAEADARLIVGYLIAYEKESDQIEARHAAEPVEPIVQAIRNLRASAPVAGEDGHDAK